MSITSSAGGADGMTARASMAEVSLVRLYLLRATYLLAVVALGFEIWPGLVANAQAETIAPSVVPSLLGAVSLLAVIGLRYPLQMLPLMFFEMIWKSTWLLAVALPIQLAGQMNADIGETVKACLMGVIFPLVIPWPYVWRHYVRRTGDRWR